MSWIVDLIAAIGIGFIALIGALALVIAWLTYKVRSDPEYREQMARSRASQEAEQTVVEQAPWFGTTGLDDELERELPKYLRREFGERLLDDDALKAGDLAYIGRFDEAEGVVHYWRIPSRDGEPCFAYIEISADGGSSTGWGNREPPGSAPIRS